MEPGCCTLILQNAHWVSLTRKLGRYRVEGDCEVTVAGMHRLAAAYMDAKFTRRRVAFIRGDEQ
jgi:hypothetical protein